jgi:DNA-binding CsgD family transcriptional regulator
MLYRHEEDFLSFGIRSEDAFTKQGIYQEEGQMRRKDGSFFDMRLTMFPVFNGEAGIDFLIAIVQDVSQDINKVREAHTLILQIHSLIEKIIPLVSPPSGPEPLSLKMLGATDRQVEITRLLLSGDSTKEIASRLNLSVSTVKNHLSALYKKLEIYDRVDLVRIIQDVI